MLETPFILYALECDGKLDTRQSKLNYFIQLLRDAEYPAELMLPLRRILLPKTYKP